MSASAELTDDAAEPRLERFRALYRREFNFVWATARRYGVPPHAVDDVVQDVFVTAYRRLDQLHFEVSARAWLHGVTRRIAARYRRSAARLARRLDAVATVARGLDDPPQERLAAAQELERLLAGLGRRTRAVFEMAEILGMSGPEIAGELGIPVSTVYSRIRLARTQLERDLGEGRLGAAIDRTRERDAPPEDAAPRTWALLAPGLASVGAGGGVGLGFLASVRGVVAVALTLAAGAVALAWPRIWPAAPEEIAAPTLDASDASDAATRRSRGGADPSKAIVDDATSDSAEVAAPVTTAPEPRVRTTSMTVTTSTSTSISRGASADADPLAAEVTLVDRAREALAAGDKARARALLEEHARRFPAGALADLRAATEVELLCSEGAIDEASARAVRLTRDHPGSAVAQRFAGFRCEGT